MGVEVGWLLQQHEIEGMKLIAGEKGLQKVMEKVNLLDNPDMIRWIKDGEFLITSSCSRPLFQNWKNITA